MLRALLARRKHAMEADGGGDVADGCEFGQSERLTRRLAGLIRGYPPGLGILKEFLQNADDAGARAVQVVLDLRTHPAEQLPDDRMGVLCGPALLVANDARFTQEDLQAIRRISESSKTASGPKTGRFGLGFNTAYNLTDHPAFVTNDGIFCFDPHRDAVARGDEHGRRWSLETMWREHPNWPRLFCPGGLAEGCADHPGTIFRLPLRLQGRVSEICEVPFAADDVRAIFAEAADVGSELLLFTRNLESLTIAEIDDAGQRELVRVDAAFDAEFRAARAALNEALHGDLGEQLANWCADDRSLPCSVCSSVWRVSTPDAFREERWRMCIGLARGNRDRLLHAATEMLGYREKAVPWFGVAARLNGDRVQPVAGRLYCGLPLPVVSAQPVHINGYFDLDQTRQHLTSVAEVAGSSVLARVRWNAALLEEGVATGWGRLLADMARQGIDNLYAAFPTKLAGNETLAGMVRRAYEELAGMPVVRASSGGGVRMVCPNALCLPKRSVRADLAEPLAAEGLPMPTPDLPEAVEVNFSAVIQELTPAALREFLHTSENIDCEVSEAPRPGLRRRIWVERLLVHATSDGSKDLRGIPLLVTSDGRLHTIGAEVFFLANEEQRALFPEQHGWFVDPAFIAETRLVPSPEARLRAMDLGLVLCNLSVVLGKEPACDWSPEGQRPPNRPWLARLLAYLVRHKLDRPIQSKLKELPILPGSDGRLYASTHAEAPLVVSKSNVHPDLLTALRTLEVTLLDDHATLTPLLDELLHRAPELGVRLTVSCLVDILYERRGRDDAFATTARPLLDYLADPRWTFTTQHRQRLAAVPMFPSDHGTIALDGGRVFLPSHFMPPVLALEVRLLQEGRRWGALYEQLGITEIDAGRYLKEVLLPALSALPPDDRRRALEWLREQWSSLESQPGWDDLRRRLREIPLVLGQDGTIHRISDLHDPDSTLIREVLGPEAVYPDMDHYADRSASWLGFFRTLGIVQELSKDRLVRHVQTLADRGLTAAPALERVFTYLDQRVDEEAAAAVLTSLRRFAWIPAKQTSRAPGFVPPEDRLYKPGELALTDRLVGSQLPVSAWRPNRAATATALGMHRNPPALAVLEHLKSLCQLCAGSSLDNGAARDLGSNFREVYIYLDRFCTERSSRDIQRFSTQETSFVTMLGEHACIWDPASARLWVPADVFLVPVPFFAPLRTSVEANGCERFLTLLGCRQQPNSEDFVSFLDDLRLLGDGAALSDSQRYQALYALQSITPETQDRVPLLTTDDRLVDSSEVYWDDAPWLAGRLGAGLATAAHDVPTKLLTELQVRRLSEHVKERIAALEPHGASLDAVRACERLAARVASSQFAAGLERLVRHEHGTTATKEAHRLTIEPVVRVVVALELRGVGSLGRTEVPQYFDDTGRRLYLAGTSEARMVKWVAQAVSRLLGALAPRAYTAPLEHILACEPAEIDAVLNEDRIPQIALEAVTIEWPTASPSETLGIEDSRSSLKDETLAPAMTPADEADAPTGGEVLELIRDGRDVATSGLKVEAVHRPSAPIPTSSHEARGVTLGGEAIGGVEEGTATASATTPETSRLHARAPIPGAGATRAGDGVRVASDSLWARVSETQPPGSRADGEARTRRDGLGGESLRIESETNDDADEAKQEIEARAIELVLRYEVSEGRSAERVSESSGYDVVSLDEAAEIRHIEVKGLAGDWRNRSVQMTPRQFERALQLRGDYWLYVVQRLSGKPRMHRIRDPAKYITRFALDARWARFGEAAPPLTTPRPGMSLYEGDHALGPITQVKGSKPPYRVVYQASNGVSVSVTFQPGKHTLKDPDDGPNDP